MPYNGSGVFTKVYSWVNDAANGIDITASRFDTQEGDFAGGFNNALTRDGQGIPTANLNWGGFNLTGLGALSSVTLNVSGAAAVGGLAVSGTATLGALGANLNFNNFSAVSVANIVFTGGTRIGVDSSVNATVYIDPPTGRVALLGGRNTKGLLPGSGNNQMCPAVAGGVALNTFDTQDYVAHQFVRDVSGSPVQEGTINISSSGTTYGTTSDERLKTNFRDLDSGPIIDNTWVGEYDRADTGATNLFGVRAQQAASVWAFPVTEGVGAPGEEGFVPWSVDYSRYVPAMLRELQLLRARVAQLEGVTA